MPLHVAIENGHDNVAGILLKHGASLEAADAKGRDAIRVAIESGSAHIVKELAKAGANVNAPARDRRTPISIAIENNWDELADVLSTLADPAVLMPDGRSLLHIAAQSGSLAWTSCLIKFHTHLVNCVDENDWTPLHYAADNVHHEV